MTCPCGSTIEFKNCCEPFIKGEDSPKTAEALMRSRYTAYTLGDIGYIKKTLAPESQKDFDVKAAKDWATNAEWISLTVMSVKKGTATDDTGVVEFTAKFKESGKTLEHHEVSEFRKNREGHWLFVDGDAHTHEEGHHHHHTKQETIVRSSPKVGRNDPCPCGSQKKYKKCHGVNA